jgi:predicted RNase H-like HicB family nuclease
VGFAYRRDLPERYPPYQACHRRFQQWNEEGALDEILRALPGCVSTGATREEVAKNMQEALELHVEGLCEEGYPVPEPSTSPS